MMMGVGSNGGLDSVKSQIKGGGFGVCGKKCEARLSLSLCGPVCVCGGWVCEFWFGKCP